MLNVSDALKKIYRMNMEPVGTKAEIKTRINFGDLGVTVTNDRLVQESFRLTERISEGGDLDFGSCYASVIEFTVADVPEDLNGQVFTVEHLVNGTYTVPLGTFKVDSCKRQDDLRFKDIVAYDNMRLFDKDVAAWYNSLSFPITVSSMRASLCSFCGVQQENVTLVNDNVLVRKTLEVTELSGKEVLRAIAEINGAFAHINRYGKLTFIGLDSFALYPSETLYPADDLYPEDVTEVLEKTGENAIAYISSKYEDYTVSAIDGVIVQDDENADGGLTVGTATNPYILSGNMLIIGKSNIELTTIATNLLNKISNVIYAPHETEIIGLPYVEVGDTVLNVNSAEKELFITKRVLTGISSVMDSFSANGNPTRQNYGTVQSSEIRKLNGKTMKIIKDIDRIGVEIENLDTQTNTLFEVADERITAEVKRAQEAETSLQLQANQIRLEVNGKIDGEEARSLFAVELGKITLSASQINLNGYFTANGNFHITNSGDLLLSGDDYNVSLTENGMSINPTDYYNGTSTYISAGKITLSNSAYKTKVTLASMSGSNVTVGESEYVSYYGKSINCTNGNFTNFSATDGDFKTLETITLTATAINGGTPLTTANMGNYLPTQTNQITASTTEYGNIDFAGSVNAASVTYVQENFARQSALEALEARVKALEG